MVREEITDEMLEYLEVMVEETKVGSFSQELPISACGTGHNNAQRDHLLNCFYELAREIRINRGET